MQRYLSSWSVSRWVFSYMFSGEKMERKKYFTVTLYGASSFVWYLRPRGWNGSSREKKDWSYQCPWPWTIIHLQEIPVLFMNTIIILVNKKLTVFSPEGLMCSTWKPMSCQQQICLLRELWTWLTNAFQELQSPFWGYRSYAFFIQETWSISQHIIYTVASHISFW